MIKGLQRQLMLSVDTDRFELHALCVANSGLFSNSWSCAGRWLNLRHPQSAPHSEEPLAIASGPAHRASPCWRRRSTRNDTDRHAPRDRHTPHPAGLARPELLDLDIARTDLSGQTTELANRLATIPVVIPLKRGVAAAPA